MLGLGDAAAARKDTAAAERYYRQALRMDSGNSNAVRGLANVYRAQSPEKASQFIQSLSASQRRSIDDIERSLTNEQLSAQAEQLENQGQYAQAAEIQRRRLALSPGDVWITYRLSRDLYSAGQRSQADNLMRQLASQKPSDPEQVYASGCISPETIRIGPRSRIWRRFRAASGTPILRSLPTACRVTRRWKRQTDCATAAKSRRRKTSFASSRPLPVST